MFLESHKDLEKAMKIEPKNKDILRELEVVKNHLVKNRNGKRSMDTFDVSNAIMQSKRLFQDVGNNKNNIMDECSDPICDSCPISLTRNVTCNPEQPTMDCSSHIDMSIDPKSTHENNGVKMVNFIKKGGGQSRLRISMLAYQKLIDGQEVSFYNKYQLSTMTVRIRNVPKVELKKQASPPNTQKRRKRCSRKRKPKMESTTSMVMLSTPPNKYLSLEDDYESQQTDSSSPATACKPHKIVPGPSLNNENNDDISPSQALVDSVTHRTFSFSSAPRICRWFKAKKNLPCTNIFRRGRPPLRHISFPFLEKFPRSSSVIMSHCRYPSEVQVQKKRKTSSSDISHSERPLKKPVVKFTYFPNLVCNFNYVFVAPDPENHGAKM